MVAGSQATYPSSPILVRYRNRDIREEDLRFIRELIAGRPGLKRKEIAAAICEAWNWRQFDGRPKMYACYDLLLRLEEWGHIKLPKRLTAHATKTVLPKLIPDEIPLAWSAVNQADVDLDSLVVRPILAEERLGWRLFVDRYHYLGYQSVVGESLLYVALLPELANDVVAFLGWGSASFRCPLREEYVGWDEITKRQRQHHVVNNVRFLVPPWVRVPNLASKVLGQNLRRLSRDWQACWGHPVYLAETFVDSQFLGTCYRASNWRYLGCTAGRTKRGNKYLKRGSPKAYYVFPLRRDFRRLLVSEGPW